MVLIDISDNEAIYSAVLAAADKILHWRDELHRKFGSGIHTCGYKLDAKKDKDFGFYTSGGSTLFDAAKMKHEMVTGFTQWLEHARTTDADYLHIDVYKNAFTVATICNLMG